MTAIAVETRITGLTHLQVASILEAALVDAERAAIDPGTITMRTHAEWTSELVFQPEVDVARDLAAVFGLTNERHPIEGNYGHTNISGDWGGVAFCVLFDTGIKAAPVLDDDPRPVAPTYQPRDVTGWSPEELIEDEILEDETEQNYRDDLAAWLINHPEAPDAQECGAVDEDDQGKRVCHTDRSHRSIGIDCRFVPVTR